MPYLENLFSLQGKVTLVTGATCGLGRAMAEALLHAGATVVMNGSNAEKLSETARQFLAEGLAAVEYACDLSIATDVAYLEVFILTKQPLDEVTGWKSCSSTDQTQFRDKTRFTSCTGI